MVTGPLTLLIQQYKDSPGVVALITALATVFTDLDQARLDLLLKRTIDTAEGVQLDVIGKIVDLTRPYLDPADEEIFTFAGPNDGAGFSGIGREDVGGFWIGLTPTDAQLMDDDGYRRFLKAKIIRNGTNATLDDMFRFASFIFDTDITILNGLGYVDLTIGTPLTPRIEDFIYSTFPVAAGVRVRIINYALGPGAFSYAGNASGTGFGGVGVDQVGSGYAGILV